MKAGHVTLAWLALSVALAACSASASASVLPTADPSRQALTRFGAVQAAFKADGRPGMRVVHVESGPASEVLPSGGLEWAGVPSGNTWVWFVNLSDGGPPLGAEGSFVVLDYFDGTVYSVTGWIS